MGMDVQVNVQVVSVVLRNEEDDIACSRDDYCLIAMVCFHAEWWYNMKIYDDWLWIAAVAVAVG